MRRRPGYGLEQHFCKNILEQHSFIYFGYVKDKYIELLKKKMTPEIWGVTAWYQSIGIRIPRARWGMGLGHAVDVWERHNLV